MDQKPGDLFLGVIEFFGILVPGAVFVLLHGDLLLRPFGLSVSGMQTAADWIPAFLFAYVLGHFLLGFSVPLNRFASRGITDETRAYLLKVRETLRLPLALPPTTASVFYSAFSYVRLHSAAALTEVERQAGEYKLFRSITLLAVIDIPLAALTGVLTPTRFVAALLVAGLAYYRFQWLFDWTYRLTFDFYTQLQPAPAPKETVTA